MKKRFLIPAFFAGLILAGCSKNNDSGETPPPPPPPEAGKTVEEILALSYSQLSPEEQKRKLETEASELLKSGDAAKSSAAVDALQNLESLFTASPVNLVGTNSKQAITTVKKTVQYADVYGVYTWNNQKKDWDKTASTSELKFVFPAKKNGTTNNATLTVTASSSGIAMVDTDYDYDYDGGYYSEEDDKWVYDGTKTETTYYLPSKAKGLLAVDGKQAVAIDLLADYQNGKQVPVKSSFSIDVSDGYKLTSSFEKATKNEAIMQMAFNNTVLFDAAVKSDIKLDDIIAKGDAGESIPSNLLGSDANGYIKILDNLVMVVKYDAANLEPALDALNNEYNAKFDKLWKDSYKKKFIPDWGNEIDVVVNKDYYKTHNLYEKEKSEKKAALYNNYMTITLASTKDGVKIAEIVQKSEMYELYTSEYDYWDESLGCWWFWRENKPANVIYSTSEYYDEVYYLKFNDNTLVEANAYFSTGFTTFMNQWEDFVKAFNK